MIRRKTIFFCLFIVILSILNYFINLYFDYPFKDWLETNYLPQIVSTFFTLIGIASIFTPITISKEITQKDIIEISLKTFEETKKENERNEKILRKNTF